MIRRNLCILLVLFLVIGFTSMACADDLSDLKQEKQLLINTTKKHVEALRQIEVRAIRVETLIAYIEKLNEKARLEKLEADKLAADKVKAEVEEMKAKEIEITLDVIETEPVSVE